MNSLLHNRYYIEILSATDKLRYIKSIFGKNQSIFDERRFQRNFFVIKVERRIAGDKTVSKALRRAVMYLGRARVSSPG